MYKNFVFMKIHIGEKIKEKAYELRIGTTELAKAVNTSKQNIYGIYKRESIDTALLYKISKALNFDFFSLYINTKLPPHNAEVSSKKDKKYPDLESENSLIKNQLMDLQEKYELLKKVNNLLEGGKKKRK